MVTSALISILKTVTVTLITSKAMKALDKKDYASIINFTGVCAVGSTIYKLVATISANPPVGLTRISAITEKILQVIIWLFS